MAKKKKFVFRAWHLLLIIALLLIAAKAGGFARFEKVGRETQIYSRMYDPTCGAALPIWGVVQCLADDEFLPVEGMLATKSQTGVTTEFKIVDCPSNAVSCKIESISAECSWAYHTEFLWVNAQSIGSFDKDDYQISIKPTKCCNTDSEYYCKNMPYGGIAPNCDIPFEVEPGTATTVGVTCKWGLIKTRPSNTKVVYRVRWKSLYYSEGTMGSIARLDETEGCYPYLIKEKYIQAGTNQDLTKIDTANLLGVLNIKPTPSKGTGQEVSSVEKIPNLYNPMKLYEWYRFPIAWQGAYSVGYLKNSNTYGDVICSTTSVGKTIFKAERIDTNQEGCYYIPTTVLAQNLQCCSDEDCSHFGDFHCDSSTFKCESGPSNQECGWNGLPSDALCGGTSVEQGVCYQEHASGKKFIKNSRCNPSTLICDIQQDKEVECCTTQDCYTKTQETGTNYVCDDNQCKPDIEYGDCPPYMCCTDKQTTYSPKTCDQQGLKGYECCKEEDDGIGTCAETCIDDTIPPKKEGGWLSKIFEELGKGLAGLLGITSATGKILMIIIVVAILLYGLVALSKLPGARGRGGGGVQYIPSGGGGAPVIINMLPGANTPVTPSVIGEGIQRGIQWVNPLDPTRGPYIGDAFRRTRGTSESQSRYLKASGLEAYSFRDWKVVLIIIIIVIIILKWRGII